MWPFFNWTPKTISIFGCCVFPLLRAQCSNAPGAICSALRALRAAGYPEERRWPQWAAGRGEALPCCSHCLYPKQQYFIGYCGLTERRGLFLFFPIPPLPSGEMVRWSPPPCHPLPLFAPSLLSLFEKYSFLSSPLQLQCFGHQSPLPAIFIYLVTLTLCKAEDFQSKPIPEVPKDVILIYSLSPLNGAAQAWQQFSSLTFREHTILFLSGAFQNKVRGLPRSLKGCQSCSKLHFAPGHHRKR